MNLNESGKNEFFYCYSPALRKFLGLSGLRWVDKGYNENTKTYYWRFTQTNRLGELLTQYKNAR